MLTFEVDPLIVELREVFANASFFDPAAASNILAAAKNLETAFRLNKGGRFNWEVRQERAIQTRVSTGQYEPNGRSGLTVVGACSWIWELAKVDSKHAQVAGNASLKIVVREVVPLGPQPTFVPLCEWNFDIGEMTHPGILVHAQLCSVGSIAHRLSVPRFPSIVLTPADALDFLLGELFQDIWAREADVIRSKHQKVAQRMRKRLADFLERQAQDLRGAPGLAIHALKGWQPAANFKL